MYRYYFTENKASHNLCLIPSGMQAVMSYREHRYIPKIDRMAWGWLGYENPLSMADVAEYELIAAPREDE